MSEETHKKIVKYELSSVIAIALGVFIHFVGDFIISKM